MNQASRGEIKQADATSINNVFEIHLDAVTVLEMLYCYTPTSKMSSNNPGYLVAPAARRAEGFQGCIAGERDRTYMGGY